MVQILFPASFNIYSLQRFYSLQHFRTFPSCGVRSILFPAHSPWHFFPGYITTPDGGLFNALTENPAEKEQRESERVSVIPSALRKGYILIHNKGDSTIRQLSLAQPPQGETACFTESET